ncbi:hypothetical protein [Dictyobacter arantiisoli]|uniref:YtkA-like domain-containing protein n=1 Tax=Dictyobacter arantiisoli TaxID=2014874 RepID=A0A5A5TA23_9CHLR|nr:hypothetical protein [Dictyobacter arantiisoli]GCF08197.1 hypothetical protein KDI_17610 [Dictyobacter arantiisoli]
MKVVLRTFASLGLLCLLILILTPSNARAATKPASSTTISAGSYIITVNLSQDPPYTDQPFTVSIMPQNKTIQLSGKIIMEPGSGTDGTNLPTDLTAAGDGTLQATVHIPVRGAWNIAIQLAGPQGTGQASIPVVVGAPGAMPPWVAWTIGASPLVLIAFWVWHQHRYRRKLLSTPISA